MERRLAADLLYNRRLICGEINHVLILLFRQPDDLPFSRGDIIDIVEEPNVDWWRGSCRSSLSTQRFPNCLSAKCALFSRWQNWHLSLQRASLYLFLAPGKLIAVYPTACRTDSFRTNGLLFSQLILMLHDPQCECSSRRLLLLHLTPPQTCFLRLPVLPILSTVTATPRSIHRKTLLT